ncbi:formin-F-like isoform X2 [Ostrea edulis]|uniref:formin-F-like isoform X2 n=1 Tax=Ostrea edulis TaxID=37623 RepID=UPI0024AEC182|nr:formin-F-like isoform X2 [Ostrea edulis]
MSYSQREHTIFASPIHQIHPTCRQKGKNGFAFTSACQEKRRTVIDFESCSLEPKHQPNQKYMLTGGLFNQSDDSLSSYIYGDEKNKSEESLTESESQTDEEERLSEIVPKTETLTCVTKDRPKKNTMDKPPLVAKTSVITEENEQEMGQEKSNNHDVKESANGHDTPILSDTYEVVKDLNYSSSEDNLSLGHEEMMFPEGDYAYPEEGLVSPQGSVCKQEAECHTYEDIMIETKYPNGETDSLADDILSELQTRQEREESDTDDSLYSKVNLAIRSHDNNSGKYSDISRVEKEEKETSLYATSLKRKQRESLKQRQSLPPPPAPPVSPIPSQSPRSMQANESQTENNNKEQKQRKLPLDRPSSQPPPPPSPKGRQSTSSVASDLSKSSASDNSEQQKLSFETPFSQPTLSPIYKDRQSISSFSSDISQSSADKSVTLLEYSAEMSASESSLSRLFHTQSPEPESSFTNKESTSLETDAQRSSKPVSPLPQWPPSSENGFQPPPPPPPPAPLITPILTQISPPLSPPTVPRPPPPPPAALTKGTQPKKLRTLHWSKLSKSQVKSSFWKHATDRKNNINTDLILEHFSIVDESQQTKTAEQTFAGTKLLLDATRARNLGIILTGLRAEGARSIREVINSVTEDEYFPAEKLTTIRRYQPTSEDIELFKLYSDKKSTLDPVDRFMCELCEIECIGTRLDFILLLWDFPRQLKCTHESIEELSQACSDLKENTCLTHLMEYILAIGNIMNNDHKNHGFPLTSIRMFMDMRGKTTDFTFSHFLVELLDEKDSNVKKWTDTMDNVTRCKNINIKALVTEIEVLKSDLTKLKKNLKTLKSKIKKPNEMETDFLHKAQLKLVDFESSMNLLEKESARIQTTYRHLLEYFGEVTSLPSNELFSALSDFAQKFKQASEDIDRKKRYQALHGH